jgi:DNA polymerase-3 subunit gamma/tau
MLGTLDQNVALNLVNALAHGEAMNVLTQVAQLAEGNPDFAVVLADILSLLQRIAIAQILPTESEEAIAQLAQQLSPETVQLFYQIGLLGRRDLPLVPEARGGFEMILLRMLAFRPETSATWQQQPMSSSPQRQIAQPSPQPAIAPIQTPSESVVPSSDSKEQEVGNDDSWSALIASLNLVGFEKQLAQNCELKSRQDNRWQLILAKDNEPLLGKERKHERKLEQRLQEKYGDDLRLTIQIAYPEGKTPAEKQQQVQEDRQETLKKTIEEDPFVRRLKEKCEAQVKQSLK